MYLVLEDVARASPHGYDPPNLASGFHTFILWSGCSSLSNNATRGLSVWDSCIL